MWLLIIVAFLQIWPFGWVWDQWSDGYISSKLVPDHWTAKMQSHHPYKLPDGTRWHFRRMLWFRIIPSQKMVGQLPNTCQENYRLTTQAYLCTTVETILQQWPKVQILLSRQLSTKVLLMLSSIQDKAMYQQLASYDNSNINKTLVQQQNGAVVFNKGIWPEAISSMHGYYYSSIPLPYRKKIFIGI